MLMQQNDMQTNAAPAGGVQITDRTVDNGRISGTCHAGIQLGLDGVLSIVQANAGLSAVPGQWLISGAAADFFVQRSILDGTLEIDPGTGFLQLNANRKYINQKASAGIKETTVFFEISSDVSGVPIVDTATMTFICEQGDL